MHVFGPYERFPLAKERAYTVDEAPLEAHERVKKQVGLERTVLVQASGYGNDNRAMLAALEKLGPKGRGVAVVPLDIDKKELEKMHAAGVRGVRLNLHTRAEMYKGDPAGYLKAYAELVAPLGWHVQLFAPAETILALSRPIERLSVPVVIDHMGMPDAGKGVHQITFRAVLDLLKRPHVWAKLAGADRITRTTGRMRDAIPFIAALAEAAPGQLVWGSDWPNLGFHARKQVTNDEVLPFRELDAGDLLDLLAEAVPDAAVRQKILAVNPQALYDFVG